MSILRKLNTVAAGLAAAISLASCNVNDDINEREIKAIPVRFAAGITAVTTVDSRAAGEDWAPNDGIGVFMIQEGSVIASNKKHVTTGNGSFTAVSGDELYYPLSGTVDFIAYYPYVTGATLTGSIDVEIGTVQSTVSQAGFDLLYSANATGKDNATETVDLQFDHQLSKLVMNVKAGEGLTAADLNDMIVTIRGMNTKNTFNLSDGLLGAASEVADITAREITPESGFAASYDAIILPSAAIRNDGDYSVDFTIAPYGIPETFTWKMEAGTDFEGGYEYIYTVTISRTGVTVNGKITPWTNDDRGGVTAE